MQVLRRHRQKRSGASGTNRLERQKHGGDEDPPETEDEMRPPLLKLGGHENFAAYQAAFNQTYAGQWITDPLGNTVSFGPNDCLHVCYGGESRFWGDPAHWKQKRAERMAAIGLAITTPNKIHPDKDYPKRRKYLLYLPPDDDTQENEFFNVLVEAIGKQEFAFITAYDIDQATYRAYCAVPPRLYPPPRVGEGTRQKRGKKKRS